MSRILLVVANLNTGGIQTMVSQLSHFFTKDHDVFLAVFDTDYIHYEYSGQIVDLKIKPAKTVFGKIFNVFRRVASLYQVKKKYAIDYSISFGESANIVNIMSKRNFTITTVHTFLSIYKIWPYSILYKWLLRLIFNFSDKIIGVSYGIKEDLIKHYRCNPKKVEVIYNYIDTELINQKAAASLSINETNLFKHPVLTCVGRLTEAKGYFYTLRIFKELKKQCPPWKLCIVGSGELAEELLSFSKAINLQVYASWKHQEWNDKADVYFVGNQTNPFPYIKNSKIYLMTSVFEGFPVGPIEAMACGIPVVSTDCFSGPREILNQMTDYSDILSLNTLTKGHYGLLSPVFKENKLRADASITAEEKTYLEALLLLINDSILQTHYHQQSLKRAADFDKLVIIDQWQALIS